MGHSTQYDILRKKRLYNDRRKIRTDGRELIVKLHFLFIVRNDHKKAFGDQLQCGIL